MSKRNERPWLIITLGVLCIVAIVFAFTTVGQASQTTAQSTRTATVAKGVVQSTVSGSGNLQPATQLDLGFKTSGTVTHIYVAQGQHVAQGQLIATLDPQSAEVALEQSRASLQSAEADLAKEEETNGEGSTGQGSSSTATGSTGSTGTGIASDASYASTATAPSGEQGAPTSTTPTTTSTAPSTTPTTTSTAPSTTPTTTSTAPSTTTQPATSTSGETGKASREVKPSSESKSTSSSTTSTISTATREANIASARAAVKSDALTVQSDEQAVANTKLYAPNDGTIASLSGQVGEEVSATGTTRATTSSSSSSSSSASSPTAATGRTSTSSSSTGSTGSSSSSFAVLADLSSMVLVVPLSESEIGNVKVGQIATVTVEALNGRKLAANVTELATLSTSSSGAVSYDVTFQLEQSAAGLKPGMSATAEVVVKQAEGINVPTSAISADSVTVVRGGRHISQAVTTGLAGNSSTIILSGLKAGETVILPTASTTGSSGASLTSKLGGLSKSGGLGGGGGLPSIPSGGGGGGFPGGGSPP